MRGGMGARQRRDLAERLAGIPDGEERVLIATGRYIGEGFDDPRLDTLFLVIRSPGGVRCSSTRADCTG